MIERSGRYDRSDRDDLSDRARMGVPPATIRASNVGLMGPMVIKRGSIGGGSKGEATGGTW